MRGYSICRLTVLAALLSLAACAAPLPPQAPPTFSASGTAIVTGGPDDEAYLFGRGHVTVTRIDDTVLVDSDNKLATEFSIAQKSGVPVGIAPDYPADTVLPTLVVTGPSGKIVYSDQTDNYRVRPEPDIFLAILRRAGVVAR